MGQKPVDAFVLAELEKVGLEPNQDASPRALVRRLTFDLSGLPPTPGEIEAFVADTSPDAYERLVDALLAKNAFGEHRARYWLDAVRYADTSGYHSDNYRSLWPYRDYVIRAFNDNVPFDRFTIEQLAGDLPFARAPSQSSTSRTRMASTRTSGAASSTRFRR